MMAVADVSIDTSASSQGEKSCKTNSDPSGFCPLWVCRPPPKKKKKESAPRCFCGKWREKQKVHEIMSTLDIFKRNNTHHKS